MKKLLYLVVAALLVMAAAPRETPADVQLKGAWKLVRAQYGNDPMEDLGPGESTHKLLTGTRWSSTFYNKDTKKIGGTCGGIYKIKGDQYIETVEYYSWDSAMEGTTNTFTMTIENGMLHQKGIIVYKDNSKYIIDEWYVRVD